MGKLRIFGVLFFTPAADDVCEAVFELNVYRHIGCKKSNSAHPPRRRIAFRVRSGY
jgi:hypothetical protein